MKAKPDPLTIEEVRRRPTITVQEYAAFVGVSQDTVYEAAARDQIRVLRLGKRIFIPTAGLLAELQITP